MKSRTHVLRGVWKQSDCDNVEAVRALDLLDPTEIPELLEISHLGHVHTRAFNSTRLTELIDVKAVANLIEGCEDVV